MDEWQRWDFRMQLDEEPMVRFRGRYLPRSQAESEIDKFARLKLDLRLSTFGLAFAGVALLLSVWGSVIERQCLRPSSQDHENVSASRGPGR